MAGKRTAVSELNHDNWDEYEAEDSGSFQRAPESILQERVMKTAKRRNQSLNSETAKKNVFSNFGFNKTTQEVNPFAFLSNIANKPSTKTNGVSSNATPNADSSASEPSKDDKSSYYAKLKGLNQSVSAWIKTHVDKNPFCILTPIFKDYEQHLKEIEKEKTDGAQMTTETKGFNFTSSQPVLDKTPETIPKSDDKPKDNNVPSFSFGTAVNSSPAPGFTFGGGIPFVFKNVTADKPAETIEIEDDEPPKPDFKPVVEDNTTYSIRCKVFVKSNNEFGDRGVGQLFLKPIPDSAKTQLIVRADTSLGNLLLNLVLSESIPLQRMGKNNVMLVCVPTPDAKPPPTPVLLRVKTSADADELLKTLEMHKK